MAVNIDALFQHLMEDPDIVPPEGEDKKDIALAMARQRAKQSNNNTKALSMASEDRSISKLLAFLLKADEDDVDPKEFTMHMRNFDKHKKVLEDGKQFPDTTKGRKEQKEFEDSKAYLAQEDKLPKIVDLHDDAMERLVGERAGEQPEGEEDDTATPTETPTTELEREGSVTRADRLQAEKQVVERERRAAMTPKEREADMAKKVVEALAAEEAEAKGATPHHSLTSAVEALSNAPPDVQLDHYGNDPDSPFHESRFGNDPKAYHNIHEKYRKEDLEEAFDHHVKPQSEGGAGKSPHSINFSGKPGTNLVESEVHNMMETFFESQGRQAAPTPAKIVSPTGALLEGGAATDLREGYGETTTEAQKWFDDNVPTPKSVGTQGVTEWDQYVKNNLEGASEEKTNDHLHTWLKGRGKSRSAPPKPTP